MIQEDIELELLTVLLWSGGVDYGAFPYIFQYKKKKIGILAIPAIGKLVKSIRRRLPIKRTYVTELEIKKQVLGSYISGIRYNIEATGNIMCNVEKPVAVIGSSI